MVYHKLAIQKILAHEGGFVDHPRDPGGATNLGVTIGTLKSIGIDVDGDGDTDIMDLKALRPEHAIHVYKRFYWDAVQADVLPAGVNYCVADYAVNSGVSRAAKSLQRIIGVKADGHVGPVTLAAADRVDPVRLINGICDERLAFMKRLKHWPTFGRGWSARVAEVRKVSLRWAEDAAQKAAPPKYEPAAPNAWTAFWNALFGGWKK